MTELDVREGTLVTRAESEQLDVDAGVIRIEPMWRFLLGEPDSA